MVDFHLPKWKIVEKDNSILWCQANCKRKVSLKQYITNNVSNSWNAVPIWLFNTFYNDNFGF